MAKKEGAAPEAPPNEHAATAGARDTAPGALAELIGVEERVRAAIRDAETETARAVAEAEASAGEGSDAEDQALDTALHELEKEIAAERSAAIAEAANRSDEALRRLAEIDEARIDELAELVAGRIAEGEPASEETTT